MVEYSLNYYTLIHAISTLITGVLTIIAFRKRKFGKLELSFFYLSLILFYWSFIGMIEVSVVDHWIKILLSKFDYIGAVFTPVIFLFFSLYYNKFEHWINKKTVFVLLFISCLTIVLVFTNNYHGLVWRASYPSDAWIGNVNPLIYEYGKWFWYVHTPFSYFLLLLGSSLFVRKFIKLKSPYSYQVGVILIGLLIPFVANLFYIFNIVNYPGLDITRVAFSITGVLFIISIYYLKFLDIIPVARNLLIEKMTNSIVVINKKNRVVDINPAGLKLFSIKNKKNILGLDFCDVFRTYNENNFDFKKILNLAKNFSINFKKNINIKSLFFELSIENLFDKDNNSFGQLLVFTDITELKKIFLRFKLATSSANIGVWELNLKNNDLFWDQQMYKLYDLKSYDFGNNFEHWEKLCYPEDLDKVKDDLQKAIKEKGRIDTSFRVVLSDNSIRYIKSFGEVVCNKNNKPIKVIGINFDISQEKELDKTKSEFISLASHKLRTPLTSVNWYVEMLLSGDSGKINNDQKSYLKEIQNSSKEMIKLVNDLLSISRIELGTFIISPAKVDIIPIIKDVIEDSAILIKKNNIKILTKFTKKIPESFMVDEVVFRIIIENLLSNAIDYTPKNKEISLSIEYDAENDNVLFQISDTGYGIPKSQQKNVFLKFFRASNAKKVDTKGSGIGLYIIKHMIEKAGGKIWFKSKENQGTTFYFSFPSIGMKKINDEKSLS